MEIFNFHGTQEVFEEGSFQIKEKSKEKVENRFNEDVSDQQFVKSQENYIGSSNRPTQACTNFDYQGVHNSLYFSSEDIPNLTQGQSYLDQSIEYNQYHHQGDNNNKDVFLDNCEQEIQSERDGFDYFKEKEIQNEKQDLFSDEAIYHQSIQSPSEKPLTTYSQDIFNQQSQQQQQQYQQQQCTSILQPQYNGCSENQQQQKQLDGKKKFIKKNIKATPKIKNKKIKKQKNKIKIKIKQILQDSETKLYYFPRQKERPVKQHIAYQNVLHTYELKDNISWADFPYTEQQFYQLFNDYPKDEIKKILNQQKLYCKGKIQDREKRNKSTKKYREFLAKVVGISLKTALDISTFIKKANELKMFEKNCFIVNEMMSGEFKKKVMEEMEIQGINLKELEGKTRKYNGENFLEILSKIRLV